MSDYKKYGQLPPTAYAEALERSQFMNISIKGLWAPIPRIVGPAFTVQLVQGDNLMLHKAIYEAPTGSIVVVDGGDDNYAVAGGNVCAIAQKRGIAGFIIDGVVRDLGEIRDMKFPVFAHGVIPIPGKKKVRLDLNKPITCGGAIVHPNDIIVADEEGIVIIPEHLKEEAYEKGKARVEKDEKLTLDEWEKSHKEKIYSHFE